MELRGETVDYPRENCQVQQHLVIQEIVGEVFLGQHL